MSPLPLVAIRAPLDLRRLDCLSLPSSLPHASAADSRSLLRSSRPRWFPQEASSSLPLRLTRPLLPPPCRASVSPTNRVGLELAREDGDELASLNAEGSPQTCAAPRFVCASHGWGALLVDHDDLDMLRSFSHVQAEVFHTPSAFFDGFFFALFKAEVLSSVLYKIRNAGPNRFACLVAVPDSPEGGEGKIVGVVDATALADANVLRCLPGTSEYLYISGMAVAHAYRRQKVATVLLEACDLIASQWGFEFLVLQAYEDDKAARLLYANNGYKIISIEPWWLSKWFGKRRRVVLAKSVSPCKL